MNDRTSLQESAAFDIERLLQFALNNGMIEPLDVIPARNALLDLFQIDAPFSGGFDAASIDVRSKSAVSSSDDVSDDSLASSQEDSPSLILERLLDYAAQSGLLTANNTTQRDLLDARIMGLLMPRQSELARKFWEIAGSESIEKATDFYYHLSKCSNYIRTDRIAKNKYWTAKTAYGELEITINLSKPEKDPEEIAALKNAPAMHYPKCLLCLENVGYAGRIDHPARQNHRVIPLELAGERWYLQYSPYVYYNEHSIVFSEEHRPMKINEHTFRSLFHFVEQFPHYFIGSNADLPIVGGSILNHDHFQGGRHVFAMEKAPAEQTYSHSRFPGAAISRVKWPMSVIRLECDDPGTLIALSSHILDAWREYSDEEADIAAFSLDSEQRKIPHNTITPIVRRNSKGNYEIDLVLRNNRTTEAHPEGIFHPHRPLHHIKKENIGLIEVMGLAVLPGRLIDELHEIAAVLTGKDDILRRAQDDDRDPLHKHVPWIHELTQNHGTSMTEQQAWECLKAEVGAKFIRVLQDAGVFKRTEQGQQSFHQFMLHAGFSPNS